MKNTKEITTGAMLLAIFGAFLLIDRQFSFMLIEIIVLAAPVLIIVFGNMYNFKDGIIFSIALLLISFILSPSIYSYFYIALGAIIGNVYNFLLHKGAKSMTLLLSTIILFIAADICYTFIVSPLLLNETFEQELVLIKDAMTSAFPPEFISSISALGLSIDDLIKSVGLASFIIVGLMEGVIVHLVAIVLLKRFKINTPLSVKQLLTLKPAFAYALFIGSSLLLFSSRVEDSMIASIFIAIGSICMFVLAYYGYIYFLMFFRARYNKNYSLFIILGIVFLFPFSVYILLFTGFLYGAGPLKKYLTVERNSNE